MAYDSRTDRRESTDERQAQRQKRYYRGVQKRQTTRSQVRNGIMAKGW